MKIFQKHAVEKLVQVGKQLLDENRGFFDNRRTVSSYNFLSYYLCILYNNILHSVYSGSADRTCINIRPKYRLYAG